MASHALKFPALSSSERRDTRRLPIQRQVHYESLDDFLDDVTANISVGGMFIRTDSPLEVGTSFRLRFTLPDNDSPIDAVGEVRWVVPPNSASGRLIAGMGVCFAELSDADRRRIERMLEAWGPAED